MTSVAKEGVEGSSAPADATNKENIMASDFQNGESEQAIKKRKIGSNKAAASREAWKNFFARPTAGNRTAATAVCEDASLEPSSGHEPNSMQNESSDMPRALVNGSTESPKAHFVESLETQICENEPSDSPYEAFQHKGPLPYRDLALAFEKIEKTSSRLEITAILTKFFKETALNHADDLLHAVYLCINKLGPDYLGIQLGVGEGILIKAIAEGTGRSVAFVKSELRTIGDLGTVAKNSKQTQPAMFKPKALTVRYIFDHLKELAQITGQASQSRKIGIIQKIMSAAEENEPKFFIRSLEGKLRIGLAEKSILVALAHAFQEIETANKVSKMTQNEAELKVKSVFYELPSYDVLIPALYKFGLHHLENACKLTPGIPVKPMLAKPTTSISEVLDCFENGRFTCEYKYDGERGQVHRTPQGETMIFSRSSEDMSKKYPDIMADLDRWKKDSTTSFIIDCEVVAWDRDEHRILPFQKLSTRKRKDVKQEDIKVKVCLFVFDILYYNGEPLIKNPLEERRKILFESFREVPGEFRFVNYSNESSMEEIQKFLDKAVTDSCEGLMVKALGPGDAKYEPSKRSQSWLKVKKDYIAGTGDSLDLVVLGAYYGKGKRTSRYGAFLLGCYDRDQESYETITKIGTGFSDADLDLLHKTLSPQEISSPKPYFSYTDGNKPDVWFAPTILMEVRAADFSLSPVYKAAANITSDGKGISLRFPRFIRIREDKKPEDATDSEQVLEFYQKQAALQNQLNDDNVDMDY